MKQSANTVVITGNLTADPERKGSSITIASFRFAHNTNRKDEATGQWVQKANFFDASAFGEDAEDVLKNLKKGDRVLIEGRLGYSEWEGKDGSKRSGVNIVCRTVTHLKEFAPAPLEGLAA